MQLQSDNIQIEQNRVSSENITPKLYRYDYPKLRIVRVYAKGVKPFKPNWFKFAVIATIYEDGVCEINALSTDKFDPNSPHRMTLDDIRVGFDHLKQFGAKELHFDHNNRKRILKGE